MQCRKLINFYQQGLEKVMERSHRLPQKMLNAINITSHRNHSCTPEDVNIWDLKRPQHVSLVPSV